MIYYLLEDGVICVFFFKQKTAYEMRISDWSSDVGCSDLPEAPQRALHDAVRMVAEQQQRRLPGTVEKLKRARLIRRQKAGVLRFLGVPASDFEEIGRASCRERVCQYV